MATRRWAQWKKKRGHMSAGLELMIVGMGTVFAFLALLVFAMHFAGQLINKLAPTIVEESAVSTAVVPAEIAVAIAAAHRFRTGGGS